MFFTFLNIKRLLQDVYDLVLPGICLACKGPVDKSLGFICPGCHRLLIAAGGKDLIFRDRFALHRVKYLYHYDEVNGIELGEAVRKLKYESYTYLAEELGILAAGVLSRDIVYRAADFITPIPLHPLKLRERGFNQSELIARKVASLTCLKYENLLARKRYTRSQAELSSRKRELNVREVFTKLPQFDITGKSIILFDDQITTGATMTDAASALANAGAHSILGLTITH